VTRIRENLVVLFSPCENGRLYKVSDMMFPKRNLVDGNHVIRNQLLSSAVVSAAFFRSLYLGMRERNPRFGQILLAMWRACGIPIVGHQHQNTMSTIWIAQEARLFGVRNFHNLFAER